MNKNENKNKIIILLTAITVTVVAIVILSNDITDERIKGKFIKFMAFFLFYELLYSAYVNYKNKKYLNLSIKKIAGNKVGNTKIVAPDIDATGIFYNGYQSAKYKFEIDGKTYIKTLTFGWNENTPKTIDLFYRIGKKDIDVKPKNSFYNGNILLLLVIILSILTYAIMFYN